MLRSKIDKIPALKQYSPQKIWQRKTTVEQKIAVLNINRNDILKLYVTKLS